eukprot:6190608-Pleurochrysis_carterae.AAC.1
MRTRTRARTHACAHVRARCTRARTHTDSGARPQPLMHVHARNHARTRTHARAHTCTRPDAHALSSTRLLRAQASSLAPLLSLIALTPSRAAFCRLAAAAAAIAPLQHAEQLLTCAEMGALNAARRLVVMQAANPP